MEQSLQKSETLKEWGKGIHYGNQTRVYSVSLMCEMEEMRDQEFSQEKAQFSFHRYRENKVKYESFNCHCCSDILSSWIFSRKRKKKIC